MSPPAFIWVPAGVAAMLVLLPPLYLLVRSLGAGEEFWELIFRWRTLEITGRTAALVGAVTGASLAISLPLAWLTARTDLPFGRIWAVLAAVPLAIPSYVAGLVIIAALGPRGMLQQLLAAPFGWERLPEIYGFPGALLTLTFVAYPYMLLQIRASLRGLDPGLEETSRSLGHGAWRTFLRVTLPQLRPAVAAGALLVALYTLKDFGGVSLLRYETFTWAVYLQYQTALDRMLAAALSLVLLVMAIAILVIETRSRGKARYHRSTVGSKRPPSVVMLGRWRWPAVAFCSVVVFLTLIMPVGVLGYWLARGAQAGEALNLVWLPALNSAYVSVLAAVLAAAVALPLAVLAVRYPGRISGLLERVSYLGFALPGIVIALALVFFGANYLTPLYQTLAMLVLAYVILFLPLAGGSIRASLLQVSPRVEEVARSLGSTAARTMAAVTLPLVRPGILAGAALVFLTAMKELPAALLLSPTGFRTLATSVWSAASEAFFAAAAAPALLLVLISIPVVFLVLRERRE